MRSRRRPIPRLLFRGQVSIRQLIFQRPVFDVQGNDVFRLIDEAYELIQSKSYRVQVIPEDDGEMEYVIEMNRRIGYLGGQVGARKNHPPLERLNLVLGDNRVITAYP
jgi:hypothetical protein